MGRPFKDEKTVSIPVRLPEKWIGELKLISVNIGVTAYAEVIRIAVKQYIDSNLEDYAFGQAMLEVNNEDTVNTDIFINSLKDKLHV